MATPQVYSSDIMKKVNDILPLYGDSNFSDILNRLWMNGTTVQALEKALIQQQGIGNTPQDVMAALLAQGIVTEEQLRQGASSYVPPNAPQQPWPFRPENTDNQGIVRPVFLDDAKKFYPDAPRPQPPAPTVTPPGPGTGQLPITTIQSPPPPPPKKKPTTPAEIEKYQREHFGNMLWVKDNPELKGLLETAAREEWTPERFKAEFENSQWWKTNSDSVRKFTERQATDSTTLNKEIDDKTNGLLAMSEAMGFAFTYQDLLPLATDAIKFDWDELTLKKNITAKVKYDPNQAGGFGAFQTQAKAWGKDYLINMTDEEAYEWSRKLFTGEATEETVQEALRLKAKGSYPTIADFIETGGKPKEFFAQHIDMAARLLEVDPSNIDLTDPKYQEIISHADEGGKVRYMSVPETARFIKQKDEYWKTNNSATEVSSILTNLGGAFGKTAF